MRTNRKKRQKKNIFDQDSQQQNKPQQQQEAPTAEKKNQWANEKYDAAKIEQNEMYINKKHKQEEHVYNSDNEDKGQGKSSKKRTVKKKKLFDSEEEDEEMESTNKPTTSELDNEQQNNFPIRKSVIQGNKAAIFDEEQQDQNIEDDEEINEYQNKMKQMTQKDISKKEKQMYEQPASFSELYEQAGTDRNKMKRILYEPIPKGYKAISTFKRVSSGFSESYQLLLEDERAVLFCENQRGSIGGNYYISMTKQMDKKSASYLGKLRGNASGSVYHLYDGGEQPGKNMNRKHWRTTMGRIEYENNFMGMNGPRKLSVVVPAAQSLQDLDGYKFAENEQISAMQPPLVVKFRNKQPKWNQRLKSYALNFGGRVKQASIKNFILVNNDVTEQQEFGAENLLVFGKYDENSFSLQASWPFSLYQAFGIVVSQFDFKLNCE